MSSSAAGSQELDPFHDALYRLTPGRLPEKRKAKYSIRLSALQTCD
jgi:hypothetical protein